jgi:hypothetical protein
MKTRVPINDDEKLEREADQMGALQLVAGFLLGSDLSASRIGSGFGAFHARIG